MKSKRKLDLLGILLMSLTFSVFTSCDKDDAEDPVDAVTLNMLNEQNGKTLLGTSDVYINKSNNFRASSNFISAAGSASGVGVKIEPQMGNLVREAAVIQGHVYQVFDRETICEFPSGARALQVGAGYYQVYVVAPITSDDILTGAMVKYMLTYPNRKGLPEWEHDLGRLGYVGETVEMALPKGAECFFEEHSSSGNAEAFHVSTTGGKLVITLNKMPNPDYGPYGTYRTYIRSGNVFTTVVVNVDWNDN